MKKTELMQGNNTALYQQLLLSGGNEAPILQKLGIESLTGKYSASIKNQGKRFKRHQHERHRDDGRRSHRYRRRSRSKSRSRSLEKPKMKALDVQSWKDFLNSGFNFDKFRKYKFDELDEKKEMERKSRPKKKHGDSHSSDRGRNQEYTSADTEKVIDDHKRYNILERKREFQKSLVVKSLDDNQTKDFPSYIIQHTKTEPVLKYSRNPAKAVCHFMNRQQFFETLLPDIEAIVQKFLSSMKPKKMKENCIDLHYYEVNDKILTLMKNKNVYPFKGWWPKLPFIVTQVKENPNVEIDVEEHMNKFSASKRVKKSRFTNESFVVDLRPTVPSKWDSDYDGSPVIDKSMDVEVAQPMNANNVAFVQDVEPQDLNNQEEMMDTTSDVGGEEAEPLIEVNVTPVAVLSKDKTQDHTKLDNEYEEFLKIVTAEKYEKTSTDNVKPVVLPPTHCIKLNDSVHEESDDESLSKSSEDSVSLKEVEELIDSKIVKKSSQSNKKMKKKKRAVNKKSKKKENKKKRRKSSSTDSSCESDSESDSSTSDSETDSSDTSSSVEIKKRKKKSKDKKKKKSKASKKKGKEDKSSKNNLPNDDNSSILNLIEKAFNVEIKKKDDSEEPKQKKKKRKHSKKEDKLVDSTEDEFQKVKDCLKETFTKLVKPDTAKETPSSLSNRDNSTVSEVLKYLKMNEEKGKKSKKSKKSKRKHESDESEEEEEITAKKLRIEEIFNIDETDKKKKSKKKKTSGYKEIVPKKKSKKKTKKTDLSANEEEDNIIERKKQKKSKKDKDKEESENFFGLRPNEWNITKSNSMRGVVHCSDTNLTDYKSIIKDGGSKNKKHNKRSKNKRPLSSSDEEKFFFTKKSKSEIKSKKKSKKSKSNAGGFIKSKKSDKRKNDKIESSDDGSSTTEFNSDSETSFNKSDDFKKPTSARIRMNKKNSSDSELEDEKENMFTINSSYKPGKNEKNINESLDYQSTEFNSDFESSFNKSDDLKNTTFENMRISNKCEKNQNESLDYRAMEFNSDSEISFNKSDDLKNTTFEKINKKSSDGKIEEKEKKMFSAKREKSNNNLEPDKNDKFLDKSDNFKATHSIDRETNVIVTKPIVVADNISHRDKVKMNLMKLSTVQHIPFIGFGPSLGFIKSKQMQAEKTEETKVTQVGEPQLLQSKQHSVGIHTVISSKIDTQAVANSFEDSDSNQSSVLSSDSSELKSSDKEGKKDDRHIEELESKCSTVEDRVDTTEEMSSNDNMIVDEEINEDNKVINQMHLNEGEISQERVTSFNDDEQLCLGVSKPAIDVETAKDDSNELSTANSPDSDTSNVDLQISKSNNELVTQWTSDWNNLDQIIGKNKSNEVTLIRSRGVRKNKSRWDKEPSPGNALSNDVSVSDTNNTSINSTVNQEQNELDDNEKTFEEISSIDCVNEYESYDYSGNWSTDYENYQSSSEIPQYSEMVAIDDDSLNPVDYSVYEDYSPNNYSYQEEFSFWSQQDISLHSNQLSGETSSIQVGNVLEILPSDDISNDQVKQLEPEEVQSETEFTCSSDVLDTIEESEILPVQSTHDEQFFKLYSQHVDHYSQNPIQYSVIKPVVNEVIGILPDTLEEIPEDDTDDQDNEISIPLRPRAYSAVVEDGSNVLYITSDNYIAYCAVEDKCMVHIAVEVSKHDGVKDEVRHCFNVNENGTVDEYWLHADLIQFNASSDGESGVFSSDDEEKSLDSECDQEIDENELVGVEWEIVDGDSDSGEEWLNDPNVLSRYGGDDVDQNIIENSYVSSSDYDTEDSDLSEENCDTENITGEKNSSTVLYEIKDDLNVFERSEANEDSLDDHKDDSSLIQQAVSDNEHRENCTNTIKTDNDDTSTPLETDGSDVPNKENETVDANILGTNKKEEEVLVQDLEQMNTVVKQKLVIQKLRIRTKLKNVDKQSDTALVSYSDNMETVKHPFVGLFQPPTISILREKRNVETLKKKVASKQVSFADGISPGNVSAESPPDCDDFDRPFSPPPLKALMRETLKMKRYVYPFRKSKRVRSKVMMTREPVKIPPLSHAPSSKGDYYISRRRAEEECALDTTANSNGGMDSSDSDSDQNDNGRTTPPKPTRQVTPVPSDDDDCSWNNDSTAALDSESIVPLE
ncbi:uncharacterized protein LOC126845156 isoform X2 [Adelges cooleyi]|nr:uncharacterized protein LOC126845156 isoform X2 [Adelges cooleyi]